MHINKALETVREAIGATFERAYSSPTAAQIPWRVKEIEEALARLKTEFDTHAGSEPRTIWPKMVIKHQSDGNAGLTAVWGPISDSRGYVLGVRVVKKSVDFRPTSTRVFIEWHKPEIA